MTRTSYPSDLTDDQWQLIEPLLPKPGFGGRPRTIDLRRVINGILYLSRTGCAWRMLPKDFGPWSTVYHYFRMFCEDDTWQRVHDKLREKVRRSVDKLPTPSAGVLDSQSVKTDAPSKTAVMATTWARKPLGESVF